MTHQKKQVGCDASGEVEREELEFADKGSRRITVEAQEATLRDLEVGDEEIAKSRTMGSRKTTVKAEVEVRRRRESSGSGMVPTLREKPK